MATEFAAPQATEETIVTTRPARPQRKEEQQSKQLPPYAVVLHNDDLNTLCGRAVWKWQNLKLTRFVHVALIQS